MEYWTRRKALHAAGVGLIGALAGCSALSNPQQSVVISVNNYQDVPRQGFVSIERDDKELVRQYVEVGAAKGDEWTTVETQLDLGELPEGTRLDVKASFGDGLETDGSITLSCASSDQYEADGDMVAVQLDSEGDLYLNEWCYDEFPTGVAQEGGVGRA